MTGKYVTTEYSITEKINSKGIRGPEYSYEKRNDEYRLLILGDSFAEGYSVEFPELFSEVLKMRLNKSGGTKNYEVINASTAGYSNDQELLLFQTEGKKYHPDLTIAMFHDNDFWYNNQAQYWRAYKPLFQLDNHNTLRLTNVPLPKPVPNNNKAASSSPAHENISFWKQPFSYIKNTLSRNSKLYRLLHDRLNNMPLFGTSKQVSRFNAFENHDLGMIKQAKGQFCTIIIESISKDRGISLKGLDLLKA